MGKIQKWLPKKRWKRVAIYAVICPVILLVADIGLVRYWRKITISPGTTALVGTLNKVGTPDYLAAVNEEWGRGVTLENNAAPLLLKIGGTQDKPEWWRNKVLPMLGLPEAGTPARWIDYDKWIRSLQPPPDDLYAEHDPEGPWTAAAYPLHAKWLASQSELLTEARQAVEQPRLFVPMAASGSEPGTMNSDEVDEESLAMNTFLS